jgi:L-lactate dehydrogenase (cytochrome)
MFQIFVDGGVRRASDVLKAVAMGATACGIGRPFLYAYSAYGPEGVQRAIQLLKAEMEMNMRLIGAPTLKDLEPNMVDVRALSTHVNVVPESNQAQIYERLSTAVGMPNEPANKL